MSTSIDIFNNDFNNDFNNIVNSPINNGYDSDTSENSSGSSGSLESSESSESSNTSKSLGSSKSSGSSGSSESSESSKSSNTSKYFVSNNKSNYSMGNYSINYYGRKKWSRSRTKQTYQTPMIPKLQTSNKLNNCESYSVELGYTSNLSKDTPFIKFLIDKRINFCQLGSSSHIAALVPVSFNSRCYFIHNGKWKGYYG